MPTLPVPGYPLLVAYSQSQGGVVHFAMAQRPDLLPVPLCGTNGVGAFVPERGSWICGKCRGALKLMEMWPVRLPLFEDRKYRRQAPGGPELD